MPYIYLMKDEKRAACHWKVGYSKKLDRNRLYPYGTHNPACELVSVIETYTKSKHKLEGILHGELLAHGTRLYAQTTGQPTEWVALAYDDPFHTQLEELGLRAFKYTKDRKERLLRG